MLYCLQLLYEKKITSDTNNLHSKIANFTAPLVCGVALCNTIFLTFVVLGYICLLFVCISGWRNWHMSKIIIDNSIYIRMEFYDSLCDFSKDTHVIVICIFMLETV